MSPGQTPEEPRRGGARERGVARSLRAVGRGPAAGEVLDVDGLPARAARVANRASSPATRSAYAAVYRDFCASLAPHAGVEALDASAVAAWRDRLERAGAAPGTVAKHLSALRLLARELGADPAIARVKGRAVAPGRPRHLDAEQLRQLLQEPDLRTRHGRRDRAILELLAHAGLRRGELCALELTDVDEVRRAADGALRRAVPDSTGWWVTVRYAKRGRTRQVPLPRPTLDAISAWVRSRPTTDHTLLFCSLPRTGRLPAPLSPRDVARAVARHATAAGLPENRRSPHVLRHTYCTHLADNGVPVEVIRELAGHADIRTTTIYTAVAPRRLEHAVAHAHSHQAKLANAAAALDIEAA